LKNFYTVIIGSELLNGRRVDKHFDFVNKELLKRGYVQKASFVIKDDPSFMEDVYHLIKSDKNSVMFSFGGIGSTPDDYTREVSAKVFGDGNLYVQEEALSLILNQFGDEAYPHRVNMAKLPLGAKLLKNVVNNVPGYYLDDRFFFTPGFPQMSQAMVVEALDKYYNQNDTIYRYTLSAECSENDLIEYMQKLPQDIDFSSLPRFVGDRREVDISVASYDQNYSKKWFEHFTNALDKKNIKYKILD
jgi:molybdopterin-biosynthesis enzyme MoeA-like protein